MSAKNDSLLRIEEIVKIYANSKYLDRDVRWVLFILAEHSFCPVCLSICLFVCKINNNNDKKKNRSNTNYNTNNNSNIGNNF